MESDVSLFQMRRALITYAPDEAMMLTGPGRPYIHTSFDSSSMNMR
jgi:hypothetical protein